MRGLSYLLGGVFLLALSSRVLAEQEVILKSGTRIIGSVAIEGADVVVQMADDKVRVPLKDVATIAAENSSPERQSQRLLFAALEARLLNGASNDVVGLLAEAKRLSPDDPSVAYWFASTLVDAGYGKAANEIYSKQHDAIAKAYPGLADQLAARIKRRSEMERMPVELVKRIDELNNSATRQTPGNEKRQYYVTFRVVDQHKTPIDPSAFRIENQGEEENLESFDDGYFVFTYARNRYNRDEPCRLVIVQPGFESKTFPFSAATNRVANAGEFVASRFDESTKRPYRVLVVDAAGKPIGGAKVALQTAQTNRGPAEAASTTTDLDGKAELMVFPMTYSYTVSAKGFNFQNGSVDVPPGERKFDEQKVALHRAINAKIRVAWQSTGNANGPRAGTTTGEAEIRASGSSVRSNMFGPDSINWLRTNQTKDRLILQFVSQPFGGPAMPAGWVRVIESDGEAKDELAKKAAEKFSGLELKKIDELKEKLPEPKSAGDAAGPNSYPTAVFVRAELGKVYVGKMTQRDMRTGQPIELSFKAIVDEMSSDSEAAE